MRWRHFRREVPHRGLFTMMDDLLAAANDFFDRHNQSPPTILSVSGPQATHPIRMY